MKIEGKIPTQGPEGRRFPAAISASNQGAKSFGAELKKAVSSGKGSPPPAPAKSLAHEAASGTESVSKEAIPAKAKAAEEPASFEDHLAMVKLRVQSGYYTSKSIDDALSDRLTGYFDELA